MLLYLTGLLRRIINHCTKLQLSGFRYLIRLDASAVEGCLQGSRLLKFKMSISFFRLIDFLGRRKLSPKPSGVCFWGSAIYVFEFFPFAAQDSPAGDLHEVTYLVSFCCLVLFNIRFRLQICIDLRPFTLRSPHRREMLTPFLFFLLRTLRHLRNFAVGVDKGEGSFVIACLPPLLVDMRCAEPIS